MYSRRHKKGFTLIEIVVVIAILGVISAIAVPKLSGFSEKAKIKSDTASLEVLNRATKLYGATNNINSEDIFEWVDPYEDEARIELLVNDGLLEKVVKAQEKGKKFEWDIYEQTWEIANLGGSDDEEDITDQIDPLEMTEDEAKNAGFKFNKETGTIEKYTGPGGALVIPSKIGEKPVIKIGEAAFAGDLFNNGWVNIFKERRNITSVIIPESVKEIGENAFKYGRLDSVIIEGSDVMIGDGAFYSNIYRIDFNNIPSGNSKGTWKPVRGRPFRIWAKQ